MLSMEKRAEMFEKNLSAYDLITLSYICKRDVQDNADEIVDNKMFAINQAIYSATSAAIYELTNLSIEQTKQIIESTNNYIKESEDFLIKYKEDWVMEIEKIKPDVKKECLKLLDREVTAHNQVAKELKKIFPNVPPKDLLIIYKETSEEYKANEKMIKEITEDAKKTATQNKPISEQKESSNAITPKKENNVNTELIDKQNKEIKGMFEVVKKEIVLKGKYGTYKVDSEAVFAGEEKFTSLQDIENYKNKQLEEFERHISEIKEAFSYM